MNVTTAVVVSCLFTLPLAAQQQDEHAHGAPAAPQAGQAPAPGHAMDMNCMNMNEHMQAMQKHMQAMQNMQERMAAMQQRMDQMERERGSRRR